MYREQIILPFITDKEVLDCGGVDHSFIDEKQRRGNWLHATIKKHASRCIGVDILAEHVAKINERGQYNFSVGNVEELTYEGEFDVVVAGELIEHVYNAGLFLDSAWRALKDNGVFIITTPNYHGVSSVLYSTIAGKEVCHAEHTCYYSRQTLCYMVERHGFTVESCHLINRPARSHLTEWVRTAVRSIRPGLSEQLVMVARKQSSQNKYCGKW
jgi:SAM-dependent methyltransferase